MKMIREHSSETRTVQTDTGETVIAPHFMAQGFIGAMKEIGKASDAFETAYTFGIVGAMNKLTEGMDELDSINFGIAAFRNSNGIPGPHPKVDETAIIRTRRGKGGDA
ncbi:hypothetical protein [Fulvimarina manganoxydans]|nr:hypothetical protein [Fulvimarina manganoxydans]